jgi:Asp-tRNA(Asn)/Glu-tRNA(Gln) amidotransferase A subunit family amidase
LITLDADSQIPSTYTSSLNADGLDGARLGLLTTLVVQEPADQTVADVITSAVIDLERLGATVIEVDIDGLTDLLDTYVVLSHEFKFGLEAYLAAIPDSPVSSLTQILTDQLHHPSVRERLEQSNAVESLDTDEYREALSRREVLRLAVFTAMDEFEIDALVYPTLRQQAARIGERQGGDNCRLSAQSGLPAITVPAGFTTDDMPVGLEMLSRRFTEPKLIEFAYAFEQGTKHRRPPSSTPPLP